ncbi:DsbE family thiol:disulfide interchange protein [Bartonella sp. A05]|uniref:DsbE family thiol:disulfide interchange protein n=1 Tax=Bartonella sp. A05 TaxID=2967261 RepID=UPI0022A8E7AF|nr:DsbE family thiol:disulfide interchange protein [Bartonella sp. A05]MCZ2203424.1 DsbE family thiol:disulfide interchange protein [Bartonella sp. A05]
MKITHLKLKKNIPLPILCVLFGPFFLFLLLIMLLFKSMNSQHTYDRSITQNALEGKPAPKINLPLLNNEGFLNLEQFKGHVTLIHFWGSWCLSCHEEHATLMQIAKDKRFNLIGINYKDNKNNAQRFLTNFGNPFKFIGLDVSGHTGINWGVYGPPETFILNKKNIIIAKHTGPLTWQTFQQQLLPKIETALIEKISTINNPSGKNK